MAARFQVKKTEGGHFQFFLLGANGRLLATSEVYKTKAACLNGIDAVRGAAPTAGVEDQATREWLAREAANTPIAKAARTAGRVLGKAKAKAEDALAPPPPPKARRSGSTATKPAGKAAAKQPATTTAARKKSAGTTAAAKKPAGKTSAAKKPASRSGGAKRSR